MHHPNNKRKVFNLKKLGFNGCLNFGYYNYHIAEPNLEIHRHKDSIEMCYYLKGEQFYEIEEELFKLRGNEFLIIPPNIPHGSGNYPEDIGELFWLQLELCENGRLCYLSKEESKYLINQLRTKERKIHKGTFALKPILAKILKHLENKEEAINTISINNLIIQLLLETITESNRTPTKDQTHKLHGIDEFIKENIYRQIYVDELADLFSLSTAYFKIWFKQNFGIPPNTYVSRIKIQRAKELMKTNCQVTKIAFELGYNSSQYFSTVFKKHVGESPKSYMKSLNK
ncbi:AraC-type DNA-binding protein [Tenacibaculum sp. MAR_2009_124]|uniref:AraC family transcriptional regulator n=1 Tax=Tenacibaculum sp. MAR_2009_124 TaxID=1250059 RepID=UPI0008959BCA|nr:AraC family transcriptional regulator [Tenacibaculum sp. MAR_2009_124]SEB54389.1 AraC-type DNA-binding protein [Tenacibaculum sp. MAR_2009_124]